MTTETNQQLEDFFGFGLDKPDSFIIPVTQQEASAISLTNKATASKIINSGKFKEISEQGEYGIFLDRKNGLTVGETVSAASTLSSEMMAVYQDLAASLTEQGYGEEQISELVFIPSNHHKLDADSRKIAFDLFKEASLSRNVEITNVTGLLSSRLTPDWSVTDTTSLPSSLYQAVLLFVHKEQNGWPEEVTEKNLLEANLSED